MSTAKVERIQVLVTKEEEDRLKDAAQQKRMSLSSFVAMAALAYAKQVKRSNRTEDNLEEEA